MKTRNWKLCTFVIFLAVCFILCAGNCYSQFDTWDLDMKLGPGYPFPGPSYDPSLPKAITTTNPDPWLVFDPFPAPIYNPLPGPIYDPFPDPFYKPYLDPFEFDWVMPVWIPPAGQTTLNLLQDSMLNLTYDRFYNMDPILNMENLYDDYSGYPGPMMDSWYLHERKDIYSRSKAGEQTLYEFTKDLLVKPREPDIHRTYGAGFAGHYDMGGMYNMSGMSGKYNIGGGMAGISNW
jgi:hypothetical protein